MNWLSRIITVMLTTLVLVLPIGKAQAGQVEQADRSVERVEVTYAEPTPTKRFPNRHYFETSDGAAYRYGTYGQCARANDVPDRVCRTVFWYAR